MKSAVLLCGGSGSRLSPITPTYTKSLIPIKGDKTNLENIIEVCLRSEVEEIILIVPPDRLQQYKSVVGSNSSVKIIANYKAYTCNNITTFALGICNIDPIYSDGCYFIDGDTYITEERLPIHDPDESIFFAELREHEWGFYTDRSGRVTDFDKDCTGFCMSGVSYLDIETIDFLKYKLTYEKPNEDDYWEEFLRKYLRELNVKYIQVKPGFTREYDNIVDLININGVERTLKLIPGVEDVYMKLDSMTNDNYLINFKGEEYIIRIPGVGSEELTHRQSEKFVHEMIENMDVTPKIGYLGTGAVQLKISKFLKGFHNWKSIYEPEYIYDILRKLKRLHDIGEDERLYYLNPELEIGKYLNLCDTSKLSEKDLRWVSDTYSNIEKYKDVYDRKDNITVVHGDMINSNILVNDIDVYLIDLEYSANCDFNWDLGDLLSEMSIYERKLKDKEIRDLASDIVRYYNGLKDSRKTDVRTVILWGAMTHFIWSIWGFARTSMGDDQLEYARQRLKECDRFLELVGMSDEKKD